MAHHPAPVSDQGTPAASTGHPPGLFLLFIVEMWERFSYYGMRGLLVLYLVAPLTGMKEPPAGRPEGYNPGRGWSDAEASTMYGWYTGLAYLLPIFGGMIADKMIGTHRSMIVGGLLIALGHVVLCVSGLGDLGHNAVGMTTFIAGCVLIVIGTGHFKPSVSVMVGQLYKHGDPRRDSAFSIFYMGINLGAFLCNIVCGYLAYRIGWHWGFGAAAVGMLLGLGIYMYFRPTYLKGIGDPPPGANATTVSTGFLVGGTALSLLFALAFHFKMLGFVNALMTPVVTTIVGVIVVALAVWFVAIQEPADRGPVASIFIFMFFNAFFWIAFEQAGSSLNLFTDRYTDRSFMGGTIDTPLFQSINPLLILLLSPVFAWLWLALGRRKLNPSQPIKIALGLIFLGVGYLVIFLASKAVKLDATGAAVAKVSWMMIVLTYFWHTVGELFLSPTGLSYVTKAAPKRFISLLMGIWFISSFIANLGGGLIAAKVEDIESGKIALPWNFDGQNANYFFLFVVTSVGAGLVILALTPLLKKLIAGRE
jgi:POT family proton-dependent oligopeptide transporter